VPDGKSGFAAVSGGAKKKRTRKKTKGGPKRKFVVDTKTKEELSDTEWDLTEEDTIEHVFMRPDKRRRKGYKIASYGNTGSGKSRFALSTVRLNPKDVQEDIELWDLPGEIHDHCTETVLAGFESGAIVRGTPIIFIGTEESVEDCIWGEDQWDMVAEHVDHDILYTEVYRKYKGGPNRGEMDTIASLKAFNRAWSILLRDAEDGKFDGGGTIVIDSATSILKWSNDYLRRKIHGKTEEDKEQGIPARYWMWRNWKMESMMLALRSMIPNTITTWKVGKDKEGDFTDQADWHKGTSDHHSNTIFEHPLHDRDLFTAKVEKCRRARRVRMKTIPWPSATVFAAMLVRGVEYDAVKKLKPKEPRA